MKGKSATTLLAAAVALALACGCGRKPEQPELPKSAPFVAFERDFQDFRDWIEVELPKFDAQSAAHNVGQTTEWINAWPAPGAKSFPVGTMIVKEVRNEQKRSHEVVAMVKRGGDYNRSGAVGWEWFELRERPDESFAISWRGMNPAFGEDYADDSLGGCNGCHRLSATNDYVNTPTLALGAVHSGRLARD